MLAGLRNWLLGILLALAALAGLFIAAGGHNQDSYYFGLGLFLVGVAGLGFLVRHVSRA